MQNLSLFPPFLWMYAQKKTGSPHDFWEGNLTSWEGKESHLTSTWQPHSPPPSTTSPRFHWKFQNIFSPLQIHPLAQNFTFGREINTDLSAPNGCTRDSPKVERGLHIGGWDLQIVLPILHANITNIINIANWFSVVADIANIFSYWEFKSQPGNCQETFLQIFLLRHSEKWDKSDLASIFVIWATQTGPTAGWALQFTAKEQSKLFQRILSSNFSWWLWHSSHAFPS